jgi:hypothetical protein
MKNYYSKWPGWVGPLDGPSKKINDTGSITLIKQGTTVYGG